WGTGSSAHLFNELLARHTGAGLVHVPYKSESQIHIDMFGGRLDYGWANPATALAHTEAGKMKPLGIAASIRGSLMPNVQTLKEQGFEGFDIDSWLGVYAPANTPEAIVLEWNRALKEVTEKPEVQ